MTRNGGDSVRLSSDWSEIELVRNGSRSCVKFVVNFWSGVFLALAIVGCAVPVIPSAQGNQAYAPVGGAYVAPTYLVSSPGWIWTFNQRYGWGWHHARQGRHKGWR
jgi:hypothetical protein